MSVFRRRARQFGSLRSFLHLRAPQAPEKMRRNRIQIMVELRKSLAWLAFLIALINLAFVPAMFFGYDAAQFYSAVG